MNEQTKEIIHKDPEVFSLKPRNLEEAIKYADMISKSALVPDVFKSKPGDILIAMQMGFEVGLNPMQALQNIAVINGRPTLWGDALLAVVQAHKDYEWHKETIDPNGQWADCTIKRKGHESYTIKFTIKDAETAGLLKKPGPWQQYPKRMLQMRARSWAIRDKFSDALRGMEAAEEAQDIIEVLPVPTPEPSRLSETETSVMAQEVPTPLQKSEEKISEGQAKALWNHAKRKGVTEEQFKYYLKIAHNVESIKDIPVDAFDPIKNWLDQQVPAGGGVAA